MPQNDVFVYLGDSFYLKSPIINDLDMLVNNALRQTTSDRLPSFAASVPYESGLSHAGYCADFLAISVI
jgi:hypothetical protein